MKKIICIHAIVHGKVQGVFYRQSTQQYAQAHDLTGWVKNNADGTVELTACGTQENIDALIQWLQQGPPLAAVTTVDWRETNNVAHETFSILR
jgi:acylphosphatase